jgi:hypothetical protein
MGYFSSPESEVKLGTELLPVRAISKPSSFSTNFSLR